MSNASVIRPGLLVSVKSTVVGGVSYQRIDLDSDAPAEEGKELTRWETRRVIDDVAEHKSATQVRTNALALIKRCCSTTSFGLLCPADQEGALDAAIAKARQLVDAHNAVSKTTRVGVYALKGRVASDDAEAARAITSEISVLVAAMDAGIKAFDPDAIRSAANRARELSGMLSEEKSAKVDAAIDQARKAARTIVARVQKEGESRATVLLDIQRGQIESARIAFLDMSGDEGPAAEARPAVEQQRFADLDIETVGDAKARGVLGLEGVDDDATITRQRRVSTPAIEVE